MASQEKTEEATHKRKEDARKKGQVVKTTELAPALTLLAMIAVFQFAGPQMIGQVALLSQSLLDSLFRPDLTPGDAMNIASPAALVALEVVGPVLGAAAVAGVV